MRGRLDDWMRETEDPLLDGPVEAPPGAAVNEQWQVSPDEPVQTVSRFGRRVVELRRPHSAAGAPPATTLTKFSRWRVVQHSKAPSQ